MGVQSVEFVYHGMVKNGIFHQNAFLSNQDSITFGMVGLTILNQPVQLTSSITAD